MTTSAIDRRARTRQTRSGIVAAARALFAARGYRATSLRDVAAAAQLTHPGLQRHFPSKATLLLDVLGTVEQEYAARASTSDAASGSGPSSLAGLSTARAATPDYLELFAPLPGEASVATHPAHELARTRARHTRETLESVLDDAASRGALDPGRDVAGEAMRIAAAWDGLQVIEQYLPHRISTTKTLATYESFLAGPPGCAGPARRPARPVPSDVPTLPPLARPEPVPDESGYQVGRDRRARIVNDAMILFAQAGYTDTSLRQIADQVGVSKSDLLHHYRSKQELLDAVLIERDRGVSVRTNAAHAQCAADGLRDVPAGAADNIRSAPGLVELYAVLCCEAIPADHPAHEHFTERFRQVLDYFRDLFAAALADGDLPTQRDPEFEALWLIALWDGLQFQWLYDHSVDIAAHIGAHLADVLPRRDSSG